MKRSLILLYLVGLIYPLLAQGDSLAPEKKRKEKQQLPAEIIDNKVSYSVTGTVDIMYGFFERNHFAFLELTLINGIRIKRSRVGIGISLLGDFYSKLDNFYYHPYSRKSDLLMQSGWGIGCLPLFASYYQEFCKTKIRPSVGASVGYPLFIGKQVVSWGWDNSVPSYNETYWQRRGLFYLGAEAGFTYRVSKKVYFNHSFVYKSFGFNIVNASSVKFLHTGEYLYKNRVNEKAFINLNLFGISSKVIF